MPGMLQKAADRFTRTMAKCLLYARHFAVKTIKSKHKTIKPQESEGF